MQGIHSISKFQQRKHRRQNTGTEPSGYLCTLCGSDRYHLVLIAEALNNRVGLKLQCGNCNASQELTEEVGIPL